ncbi:hypothetical protein A0256_13645 [Mucilaginibacter sp. PAMC 26640]|nr:hypothetical protein A0256_13645 [Mucilaginibacter sp. PAMC 26640]
MSIIIASIDHSKNTVHIGTDRKQVSMSGKEQPEEFVKLFKIKSDLYYAINGNVNNGLELANLLLGLSYLDTKSLVDIVSKFEVKRSFGFGKIQGDCMFVLAGHHDGKAFIYARDTEHDQQYTLVGTDNAIMRLIASPNIETAENVSRFFLDAIGGGDHEQAIKESIVYASTISNTIGSVIDYACLDNASFVLESNIAATGTLIVGDAVHINAGVTGVTDEGDNSIRFWAGAVYADRETAPFRVTDDGRMFSTSGRIANWDIDNTGLSTDGTQNVYIKTIKRNSGGSIIAQAYIGTDGTGQDNSTGVFVSTKPGASLNKALYARAYGSTSSLGDIAGHFVGQVLIDGGVQTIQHSGSTTTVSQGYTGDIFYTASSGIRIMKFVNGILVGDRS